MQDFLWAACEQASIIAFIEATTFFFLFVAPGKLRQTAGILFDGMIWTDQSSRSTSQASELDMALKEGGGYHQSVTDRHQDRKNGFSAVLWV